jgi:argininosuccinate lyase
MLRTARFEVDRLAEAATADFSLATDAADLLARHGVPFREAHETVGRLVGRCVAEGRTFADLSDAEWAEVHPVFGDERPPRTAAESVAARDVPGGVAPRRVAAALAAAEAALTDDAAWLDARRRERDRLLERPATVERP